MVEYSKIKTICGGNIEIVYMAFEFFDNNL